MKFGEIAGATIKELDAKIAALQMQHNALIATENADRAAAISAAHPDLIAVQVSGSDTSKFGLDSRADAGEWTIAPRAWGVSEVFWFDRSYGSFIYAGDSERKALTMNGCPTPEEAWIELEEMES